MHHTASPAFTRSAARTLLLAALAAASAGAMASDAAAREAPKWFVLRTEQGNDCWTAQLVVVAGQYARGSALIAGGPYDTEDEAEARLTDLVLLGTCRGE